MRVKLVNPDHAAGLIDPVTRRSPFIDPTTNAVIFEVDVPDVIHWHRRIRDGEITVVEAPASVTDDAPVPAVTSTADTGPINSAPLKPLTTRG